MEWDGSGVAFDPETWAAALRVLKPGGWLVAFSGARTYHRMACAIEDAGFEIRDQIMWIYGSGFPKGGNRDGKGTCLKPAHEPIVLARKPLIGSVAANEAAFGTGALNIDACRVHGEDAKGGSYTVKRLKPGATLEKTGGNWPRRGRRSIPWRNEARPVARQRDARWFRRSARGIPGGTRATGSLVVGWVASRQQGLWPHAQCRPDP